MYLHKSVGLHKYSRRCFSPTHTELCFYILLTHVYIIYMYTYYKHRDAYITVLVQFHFPQRKQLLYPMSNTITHVVVINYESRQVKEFLSPWLQPSSARWWWQLGLRGSRQCFQHTLCAPALSRVGCPWGHLSLDTKHSSQQKPGSPHSPLTRYQCIPFSLPALGNWWGFWKLLGLILGCVNSHSCSGMEQHPHITNRNLGSCRLVLLPGRHSYSVGGVSMFLLMSSFLAICTTVTFIY